MNLTQPFFYLYCINVQCKISIYKTTNNLRIQFNAQNIAATFLCANCRQKLASAMDLEIEQLIAVAGVKLLT